MKRLHRNGNYSVEQLFETKEYAKLVEATSKIFNGAVQNNDIPAPMLKSLQDDVFVFSGLKTHAELFEASRLLMTDEGTVKPFSLFSRDVAKLKKDYNEDYLQAEYQFAVTSAQMAGKWAQVSNDYDLQYRTAADDRVRESHRALHNVTLPADDPFWIYYYPPNGWRCRCNAVQVRKGKNELSDSAASLTAGEKATTQLGKDGKNKLEIFRFNPGIKKVVFPPSHPYNKVQGATQVKKAVSSKLKDTSIFDNQIFEQFNTSESIIASEEWYKRAVKINSKIRAAEALSVHEYTGTMYYDINKYLRSGKAAKDAFMEAYARVTDSGLSKLKSFKGMAYRGTELLPEEFAKYRAAFDDKSPYTEPAFFSTTSSVNQKFRGNTMYMIHSKNGKSVREVSSFSSEEEVLFRPGTRFKVVRAESTEFGYEIELKEI